MRGQPTTTDRCMTAVCDSLIALHTLYTLYTSHSSVSYKTLQLLFSDTSSCMQYCIFLVKLKFVNLILFLFVCYRMHLSGE